MGSNRPRDSKNGCGPYDPHRAEQSDRSRAASATSAAFSCVDEAFYTSRDIERREEEVTEVDAAAKTASFRRGRTPSPMDALLVATGGRTAPPRAAGK